MARKLAPAVALISMVVSATALALGLGDIQTRSALNQNFEAEVKLLSVDPTELDSLKVRLASPEAFQRAGVERPFYLSRLRFVPMVNKAGQSVIRVYSDNPIREPFLNFLLEINWPKGKLVREYTVLLDPPTTLERRPGRVDRSQTSVSAGTPSSASQYQAPTARAVLPNEYRVQNSDTLWGIAKELRPSGVSLTQTLMALYKANPDAFIAGDINRLKKGRILRVPSRDDMLALSRTNANAAYRSAQDTALAARAQPSAEPLQDGAADAESAGDAATGSPDAVADASAKDAELRIATPSPEGEGEAGAGDQTTAGKTAADLENALLLARENAETSRQAADNLREEVSTLEQQLADMQRLLSLKDEQLARLQVATEEGQADQAGQPVAPGGIEGAEPAASADNAAGPAETTAAIAAGEEAVAPSDAAAATDEPATAGADAGAADVAEDATAPADDNGAAAVADATEPSAEVAPTDDAAAQAPAAVADDQPEATAEAPVATGEDADSVPPAKAGLIDRLLGEPGLLAGAAAAVVALLLGLLMLLRRKSKDESDVPAEQQVADDAEESILLEPGVDDADLDMPPEDTAGGDHDTSFLSEFSASEMHSLADETSEVDPVSEADVYIAYGRYDQAEELLSQALNRDPDRLALKFKLLEVYYANRNVGAFTDCAQQLADAGQDGVDGAAWQRVCDMGRDLAPEYPLFTATVAASVPRSDDGLADFEPSEPAGIDPLSGFDEQSSLQVPPLAETSPDGEAVQQADADRQGAVGDAPGDADLDLTLDLDDMSMPHSISQDDESIDGLESIDLELPDLDMDPAKPKVDDQVSDDSLILDLDTGLEDSMVDSGFAPLDDRSVDAESLQAQLEELSDLTELDDELSQLTADFEGLDLPKQESAGADATAAPGADLDIPSPFSEQLGDEDEVQTKLDLAIAYVEMGDKEGARSILDEVKAEGNDNQKAEADKLLADIG